MRNWPLIACLLLAGCSNNLPSLPSIQILHPAPEWSDLNGTPIQTNSSGQAYFVFPSTPPGVNYVTKPVNGLSANAHYIRITYSIAVTGSPVFDYRTHANNTCGIGYPGTVRLFIQRAGDNLGAQGEFAQYRYWAVSGFKELAPGLFVLEAPMAPDQWSDVYGAKGSDHPDLFAAAVANAGRVGVTFGGGCFAGHGVFVHGGTAQFTINDFTVQ